MKPALWLPAVVLSIGTMLGAQHPPGVPVVNADGPTIIGFFPNASRVGSDDADGNEALSDFEFYAERVRKPLSELRIKFTEVFDRSFRIRSGSKTVMFTPKGDTPGYYFVQRGKKPRIEYGVMTDSDPLASAKQYFGLN